MTSVGSFERSSLRWIGPLLLLLVLGFGCRGSKSQDSKTLSAPELSQLEESFLEISTEFDRLESDLLEGGIPGPNSFEMFDSRWVGCDLLATAGKDGIWAPESSCSSRDAVWREVTASLGTESTAQITLVRGNRVGTGRVVTALGLSASGVREDGRIGTVEASAEVLWERVGSSWVVVEWKSLGGRIQSSAPMFKEVLAEYAEEDLLLAARRSIHEELVHESLTSDDFSSPPHFGYEAFDRHPGLAVADLDSDGSDEILVLGRHGKALLLRVGEGGKYVDVASQWGLELEGPTNAALFLDLDNDGDLDLVVGRWLSPSTVYRQDEGRFVQVENPRLPSLVSSVAAADVDGDGLLDLYFSTYAASALEKFMEFRRASKDRSGTALEGFLGAQAAEELAARLGSPDEHFYLARSGPPNRLMMNRGGLRFEPSEGSGPSEVFRNTYQATFADYDNDGDPDLYLANDFSSNHLFRNDLGRFVDVTEASGSADVGFGMGGSWGDFDRDGDLDLYVSNMDSKAGRRITSALPNVDDRIMKAARGNSLLRNDEGRFSPLRGPDGGQPVVARAGWSWGGVFGDFDNDSRLDLYVPSGYYTSPLPDAAEVDT